MGTNLHGTRGTKYRLTRYKRTAYKRWAQGHSPSGLAPNSIATTCPFWWVCRRHQTPDRHADGQIRCMVHRVQSAGYRFRSIGWLTFRACLQVLCGHMPLRGSLPIATPRAAVWVSKQSSSLDPLCSAAEAVTTTPEQWVVEAAEVLPTEAAEKGSAPPLAPPAAAWLAPSLL